MEIKINEAKSSYFGSKQEKKKIINNENEFTFTPIKTVISHYIVRLIRS